MPLYLPPAGFGKAAVVTPRGDIGYALNIPLRDRTTHVHFEPLDFIARLAALVPPRLNHMRTHGVFAPNIPYRAQMTWARRGRGARLSKPAQPQDRTPAEQRLAMRWVQRLKRAFQIDVEIWPNCGGTIKLIACIEDPTVIERILNHLASMELRELRADSRVPPSQRRSLLH